MLLLWAPAKAATAQPMDPMAARLSAERLAGIDPGEYMAGDSLGFSLVPYGDKYLLRFDGSAERYVLTVERVLLGGRVLLYDTGATAIRVSVWGGMTLYTADAPDGLPATRVGDITAPPRAPVSRADLVGALSDEAGHLAYTRNLHLRFTVQPGVLSGGDDIRSVAFDALVSAAAGIERLLASPGGLAAVQKTFNTVKLVESDHPGVTLSGKTLEVGFAPLAGVAGNASSREVAYTLGKMLSVSEPG